MRSMKDYLGSMFRVRKGVAAPKLSVNYRQVQISRKEPLGGPSSRTKVYERGDIIANKYEVHSLIGQGGFGMVYLVIDRKERQVAALGTDQWFFLAGPRSFLIPDT